MKSFLHGRPTGTSSSLSNAQLGGAGGLPRLQGNHASAHNADTPEPTVECVKQGDKVVRLIVTCGCGQRIEVECLYPAGG